MLRMAKRHQRNPRARKQLRFNAAAAPKKQCQCLTVVAVTVLVPLTLDVVLALPVAVERKLAVRDAVADGDPDAVEDLDGVADADCVDVRLGLAVRVAVLEGDAVAVDVEDPLMDPVGVADALEVPLGCTAWPVVGPGLRYYDPLELRNSWMWCPYNSRMLFRGTPGPAGPLWPAVYADGAGE
jgi:hypothetical protein